MIENLGSLTIAAKSVYIVIRPVMMIWKFSKSKLEQEYHSFRILKKWKLTNLNNTFKSIYFHSIYNLSQQKSYNTIRLFTIKEVVEAFQRQLTDNTDWSFKVALVDHLHTNPKVRVLKNESINIQEEIDCFEAEFRLNTNRARKPESIEQFNVLKQVTLESKEIQSKVSKIYNELSPLGTPVLVSEYVEREEESDLYQKIKLQSALLLTGISFCGKSQLARKISDKLVTNGYNYLSGSDIGEAERFLRYTNEPRVYLLDDPFGHNSESESSTSWRKVEELLKNLRPPNKLIITSRSEIIKSINNATSIEECSIDQYKWNDLTTSDRDFLLKTWYELCRISNISQKVASTVEEYLKHHQGEEILQPGQLNHLSKVGKEKLEGASLEVLLHLARADSRNISLEIQKRGIDAFELFVTLGLGATTNISISYEEISYILNNSGEQKGYLEDDDTVRIQWGKRNNEETFPEYSTTELSESSYLNELGFLQARGFVEVITNTVWFSHPTYREAARYILFANNVDQLSRLDRILDNALSTLNPRTSINCAKQLRFIYNNTENDELRKIVRKHGYNGAWRSIFPGVRDSCFSFLLEILNDLPSSQKSRVLGRLQDKFSTSQIRWKGEIPFIDPKHLTIDDRFNKEIEDGDFNRILESINSREEISPSAIWDFLIHLKKGKQEFSPSAEGILHMLSSDEVFIRNRVALLTLRKSCPKDERIIEAIFSDNHPSVIFEGMKGAMLGFPNYNEQERLLIKSYLNQALEDPFVVIRANNLFSTFGIDYGGESINWKVIDDENKAAIWELWGELFPVFLNNYPENLRFANSGRFGATLQESVNYLSYKQGLKICEAYYGWLEKYLYRNLPDTYEFAVLPYLLEIVTEEKEVRFTLFQRIFSHPDTNFLTYSLAWCINYWNRLTEKEIEFIITLLKSDRQDKRWILATCLTQHEAPREIQEYIFGNATFFDQEVKSIVTNFNPKLLNDCLNIFCGYPQPLWWLGFHHNGTDRWYKIVKFIIKNEFPIGFDICLREMIGDGVNGFQPEWKEDGFIIWDMLCRESDNKERLADRLIFETSRCSCSIESTQKLWHSLIRGYGNDDDELVKMIVDNLEILQNNHPEDLLEFFNNGFFETKLLPKLPLDELVIRLLITIKDQKISSADKVEEAIIEIMKLAQHIKLKLDITFKMIKRIGEPKSNEFPALVNLLQLPNLIQEEGRKLLDEMDDHFELENWNSIARSRTE